MVDIVSADNQLKDLDLDARLQVNPKDLVGILSKNEKMLISLKSLFANGWDEMIETLEGRLKTKPYISSLADRIKSDIIIVTKLRNYELEHNVELSTYLADGKL